MGLSAFSQGVAQACLPEAPSTQLPKLNRKKSNDPILKWGKRDTLSGSMYVCKSARGKVSSTPATGALWTIRPAKIKNHDLKCWGDAEKLEVAPETGSLESSYTGLGPALTQEVSAALCSPSRRSLDALTGAGHANHGASRRTASAQRRDWGARGGCWALLFASQALALPRVWPSPRDCDQRSSLAPWGRWGQGATPGGMGGVPGNSDWGVFESTHVHRNGAILLHA